MLELRGNELFFSFPEISPHAKVGMIFHRTLRIPDDGKAYPLPPSVGCFPICLVDDHKEKVPEKWLKHGGVMLPMWQSEAMWIQFVPYTPPGHAHAWPFAIKVSTGKRSAITGKPWSKTLREGDYCIIPEQPWLDGYVIKDGVIRQFVAAPLGLGATVEEQITGKAEFGGLQIEVYPMKRDEYEKRWPKNVLHPYVVRSVLNVQNLSYHPSHSYTTTQDFSAHPKENFSLSECANISEDIECIPCSASVVCSTNAVSSPGNYEMKGVSSSCLRGISLNSPEQKTSAAVVLPDMGLAPGGQMEQQVFSDKYGHSSWALDSHDRCFVHLSNSLAWKAITGHEVPTIPLTAADYSRQGFPWYSFYQDGAKTVTPNKKMAALKSAVEIGSEKNVAIVMENASATPKKIVDTHVRDGEWK